MARYGPIACPRHLVQSISALPTIMVSMIVVGDDDPRTPQLDRACGRGAHMYAPLPPCIRIYGSWMVDRRDRLAFRATDEVYAT
jgi:hypothetical protein